MRVALYPGTFDPFTHGHLDLVRRASGLVDHLVVAVVHSAPRAVFSGKERVEMARTVLRDAKIDPAQVQVAAFDGLVVEAARAHDARILIRGVRGAADLDYELRMAFANTHLAPEVETVYLPPSPETIRISGSLVREVAALGGDVSHWVHPMVAGALATRLGKGSA